MFRGCMVALVTPMCEDGSIDFDALTNLVDMHVQSKTNAIIVMGTTGESATLNFSEHCSVVDFIIKIAAGRIPVIAGTGANSTEEAIELTQYAKDAGADACLLVTPYYNKPTQEGLYLHYKKIAEDVDIPQILYNVPGRTACDLLPETVARLAKITNIIGIKEATGDISRVKAIVDLVQDASFALYTGDDATAVEFILLGGHGGISVTANVVPQKVSEVYDLALKGKTAEARLQDKALQPLHDVLFCESNPIPVKWALYEMKKIGVTLRLPLTTLSKKYQSQVKSALINAGAI